MSHLPPPPPPGSTAPTVQRHGGSGDNSVSAVGSLLLLMAKSPRCPRTHYDRPPALGRLCPVLLSILMRLDQAPN